MTSQTCPSVKLIRYIDQLGRLTIPAQLRRELSLTRGTRVEFFVAQQDAQDVLVLRAKIKGETNA